MASFWAQHGYGKADKLQRLNAAGLLAGVVLSPADEEPATLRATVSSVEPAASLLDPQTYVYSIPGGTARCHPAHQLDFPGLNWGMSAAEVESLVKRVIAANDAIGLQDIIAPSCLQRSFGDVWTGLSLQMTRTTLDVLGTDRRIFVSCVIDESALDQWRDVESWLDVVTQLDAHGFYVIVARTSQAPYPASWVSSRLVNFLRLIYSLGELNGYELVTGYSDVEGALAVAAGASGAASGWYYSLRAFSEGKWQPSTGGRAPSPRVFARGLLTPISAIGEGERAAATSAASSVFPDPAVRHQISTGAQNWSQVDSWNQHLHELSTLVNDIGGLATTAARLDAVQNLVDDAITATQSLENQGIPLATAYRPRLEVFRDAAAGFRAAESI